MRSPASGDGSANLPGERELVEHIRQRLPPPPASLIVAVGDDAAVSIPERGAYQVLTTDALVEGIHFDRRYSSLADVGYKAIAVNVSDVAAMGGAPALLLLSLILPETTSLADVDALLDGALEMAALARATIAGGNIARSPGPLIVDVTATGHVRPRRVLTRSGGRPGDALYVTGSLGAAAAGLAWLKSVDALAPGQEPSDAGLAECVARHRRPQARLRIGAALGRTRTASACMDLSDGLADGVAQLASASGTGARIDASALPLHPAARAWLPQTGSDPIAVSLSAGDDYELLFALGTKRAGGRLRAMERLARGVPLTRIGELTAGPALVLDRDGRLEPLPRGFAHF